MKNIKSLSLNNIDKNQSCCHHSSWGHHGEDQGLGGIGCILGEGISFDSCARAGSQ